MASQQLTPNDADPGPTNLANVQVIQIDWDPTAPGGVTVKPPKVKPGTTVRFENSKGEKVRIVFLSSDGKETDSVADSQTYTLATEGTFSFECFFTAPGLTKETKAKVGGVIVVTPHVP